MGDSDDGGTGNKYSTTKKYTIGIDEIYVAVRVEAQRSDECRNEEERKRAGKTSDIGGEKHPFKLSSQLFAEQACRSPSLSFDCPPFAGLNP